MSWFARREPFPTRPRSSVIVRRQFTGSRLPIRRLATTFRFRSSILQRASTKSSPCSIGLSTAFIRDLPALNSRLALRRQAAKFLFSLGPR